MTETTTPQAFSAEQFSKIAVALLGKARGEKVTDVDLSDRAQLLAFAEALVDGNTSDSASEEEEVPRHPLPSPHEENSSEETDEEAEIQRMLAAAQTYMSAAVTAPLKPEEAVVDTSDEESRCRQQGNPVKP